jgi:hypothetical protein
VFRKNRFGDLVRRQLDLFEEDEQELLAEAAQADSAWTTATAEDSEDLYSDYQLVADAIGERLHAVRETYAASLDGTASDEYRSTFDAAARRRFRRFASLLEGE